MEMHFLKDLAIVMFAAGAMTLLCHRLKQPVVIGYLLAGLFVGPYTPPVTLVSDLQSIHTMAELGLVFLMFALGLEFNLPKIRKVGMSAGLAVLLEVAGMMVIGYALGRAFGWSVTDSIFLGSILCISSTTIIVKVFMDFKMMQERFAQVVFGILVLEDIVAVAILSILSGLGTSGGPDAVVIVESFLRIGLFVTLFLVLGLLIIPRFIQWVGRFDSKEVLGVVTLGLCLGGAWLAASFNFSIALGAFLMGAVLAASKEIKHIEEWIHPVRDMFSAVFFVSAGMLIQPALLWEYKIPIVIITAVTIMGKVLSGTVGSFVAGYDVKTSARVGMSLAQIGEFSFVIASLGLSLRLTSDFLYPLAVTVSSLTTLATPYLIRHSDSAVDFFFGVLPAPLRVRLDRVQQRREKENQTQRLGRGTSIFSKYLVRFGVYAALLVFFVLSTQVVSGILGEATASRAALWSLSVIVCLPLCMAISKYVNHVVLLTVTKSKWILQRIDIHFFYNTLNALTMGLLAVILLATARGSGLSSMDMMMVSAALLLVNFIFRRALARSLARLETILDHVIGLATSEPTRQAVLQSGDNTLLLFDITDQVTLPPQLLQRCRTLRELQLREKTGASVVAIYREGKHIANPAPDLELHSHDVLVFLGDKEQLAAARRLLLPH